MRYEWMRNAGVLRIGLLVAACLLAGLTFGSGPRRPTDRVRPSTTGAAWVNGLWFNGSDFEPRIMYVVNSRFTDNAPTLIDRMIDLEGQYVLPPFAESHTHTLVDVPERIDEFLSAGILYAQILNSFRSTWEANRDRFNTPDSVDVLTAVAGLTASDGHPVQIGLRVPGSTIESLDGEWIHTIDERSDIEEKWPSIASGTDFIKTFLVASEEYEERRMDPAVTMRYRGMNPDFLAEIVGRAHADGLTVATHVRTAHDFHVAVDADVDQIAHLPGFALGPSSLDELDDARLLAEVDDPARFLISQADATLAVSRNIAVHTTIHGLTEVPADLPPDVADLVQRIIDAAILVQTENLATLRTAGVTILIGSDSGEENVIDELLYLDEIGPLSRSEILDLATRTTPQTVFPGRPIGRLQGGYEASFVVLSRNPLADLANVRSVAATVKAGIVIAGAVD